MITFYYEPTIVSCRKAKQWFERMGIEVCEKRLRSMSREDLFQILVLSEEGFCDILKNEQKAGRRENEWIRECQAQTFNEGLEFILEHLEVLRLPIIFDQQRLMVGFNAEEIRVFVSKSYRRLQLEP